MHIKLEQQYMDYKNYVVFGIQNKKQKLKWNKITFYFKITQGERNQVNDTENSHSDMLRTVWVCENNITVFISKNLHNDFNFELGLSGENVEYFLRCCFDSFFVIDII